MRGRQPIERPKRLLLRARGTRPGVQMREAELEVALDAGAMGTWTWEIASGRVRWSEGLEYLHGLAPGAFAGTFEAFQRDIHPDDREHVLSTIQAALEERRPYELEYRIVRPDGTISWLQARGQVFEDGRGRPAGMSGVCMAIDERKQAERRQAAQYAVTRVLAEVATLADATPKILEAVCESLDWQAGAIWVVDRRAVLVRCVEFWHAPSADVAEFEAVTRTMTFPRGVGLPGSVWEREGPIWIPNVVEESNFPRAPFAARSGLHAAFAVPILIRGRVHGVVEFYNREIQEPDEALLSMMASIGSQIGQFVERKQAEEELQETKEELQALIEASPVPILAYDPEGLVTLWNPAAERVFGWKAEEAIGRLLPIVSEEMRGEFDRIRGAVLAGRAFAGFETTRRRKDGSPVAVSISNARVRDPAGAVRGVVAVVADISQRKRLEEEVSFRNTLLEAQSEASIDGILVVSPEGKMIYFNSRFVEMWEIPDGVVESRSDEAALESVRGKLVDPQEFLQRVSYLYEHPAEESHDEIALKDGRTFYRFSAPVTGADGTVYGRVWFFRDISEQKAREERLAFLTAASELLAGSLHYEHSLKQLAGLAVPRLADWCTVELVDDDGSIVNVAVAHADESRRALAAELRLRYPPDPESAYGLANVIRTGRPELYSEVSDSLLVQAARDEEQLRIIRSLGLRSAIIVPLTARGRTLGAITLVSAESQRRYGSADLAFAEELAQRAALAVDNARLYEEEQRARAEAEATSRRIARLQAVTAALAGTLTQEQVAEVVVREASDAFGADAAAVFTLVEGDSAFELMASIGYPEELVRAEDWARFPADMPGRASEAVQTGEVVVVESPEELLEQWPHLADEQTTTGELASICAPFLTHGKAAGVIYMTFQAPRRFSDADRAVLSTFARHCAQALERARLYEAEQEARADAERLAGRLRALRSVIDATLAPVSLDELLHELLERLREVLHTDSGTILIVEEEDATLVTRASVGIENDALGEVQIPIGQGFSGRIAASHEPLVVEDASAIELVSPVLRASGIRSLAGVPLLLEGRAIGVLHVGTFERREFSRDDVRLLRLVASRAAIAIERAALYEREHRIAETLQRSLLPEELPDLPGLALAARYIPGSAGLEVGGDWYDVIPFEDGRTGVVVGDVVGRGVAAAAMMGQLRNAVRAYALEGFDPATVLERLNRLTGGPGEDLFATLLYLVVDPVEGTICFAAAGHPPPLVVAADGLVSYLEGGRSLPLGAAQNAEYIEAKRPLEQGSTVLLYTDGLVERRDATLEAGLRRLEQVVRAGPADLEALLDRVLDELSPSDEQSDDVAIVAVRLVARPEERLRLRLPAEPRALASLRAALGTWLGDVGASADDIYDITVACNEACSNAIEHPIAPSDLAVEVEGSIVEDEVSVIVRDFGQWRTPAPRDDRGRGLEFMEALMEAVEVKPSTGGTEVRMRRRIRRGAAT